MAPTLTFFLASPSHLMQDAVEASYQDAVQGARDIHRVNILEPIHGTAEIVGQPDPYHQGIKHAKENEARLRRSHIVLADFTPVRGPHAEASVAYWVGLAKGLGKPVFGFTTAPAKYLDRRVKDVFGCVTSAATGYQWDGRSALLIEPFEMTECAALEFACLADTDEPIGARRDTAQGLGHALARALEWVAARQAQPVADAPAPE